jgi:hypothetical protein
MKVLIGVDPHKTSLGYPTATRSRASRMKPWPSSSSGPGTKTSSDRLGLRSQRRWLDSLYVSTWLRAEEIRPSRRTRTSAVTSGTLSR